jgi:hypothetical protein
MANFEANRSTLETRWFSKRNRIITYFEDETNRIEKLKYLIHLLIYEKSRHCVNIGDIYDREINIGNIQNIYFNNNIISLRPHSLIYSNYINNWLSQPDSYLIQMHIGNDSFTNLYTKLLNIFNGISDNNMLLNEYNYCISYISQLNTDDNRVIEFIDGFLNCMNNDPTFTIEFEEIENNNEMNNQIENEPDKIEKFRLLANILSTNTQRLNTNIDGQIHHLIYGQKHIYNKIYIDYISRHEHLYTSDGVNIPQECNMFLHQLRGSLDSSNAIVQNALSTLDQLNMNDEIINNFVNRFIDGFLNCMNIDDTFN